MRSDARGLLFDVVEACRLTRQFAGNSTAQSYQNDRMLQSACERQLEIVGEAMSRLRDRHRDVFEQVPDGAAIVGLRNRLIHGYDAVDSLIVWDVITSKLPELEVRASTLLAKIG